MSTFVAPVSIDMTYSVYGRFLDSNIFVSKVKPKKKQGLSQPELLFDFYEPTSNTPTYHHQQSQQQQQQQHSIVRSQQNSNVSPVRGGGSQSPKNTQQSLGTGTGTAVFRSVERTKTKGFYHQFEREGRQEIKYQPKYELTIKRPPAFSMRKAPEPRVIYEDYDRRERVLPEKQKVFDVCCKHPLFEDFYRTSTAMTAMTEGARNGSSSKHSARAASSVQAGYGNMSGIGLQLNSLMASKLIQKSTAFNSSPKSHAAANHNNPVNYNQNHATSPTSNRSPISKKRRTLEQLISRSATAVITAAADATANGETAVGFRVATPPGKNEGTMYNNSSDLSPALDQKNQTNSINGLVPKRVQFGSALVTKVEAQQSDPMQKELVSPKPRWDLQLAKQTNRRGVVKIPLSIDESRFNNFQLMKSEFEQRAHSFSSYTQRRVFEPKPNSPSYDIHKVNFDRLLTNDKHQRGNVALEFSPPKVVPNTKHEILSKHINVLGASVRLDYPLKDSAYYKQSGVKRVLDFDFSMTSPRSENLFPKQDVHYKDASLLVSPSAAATGNSDKQHIIWPGRKDFEVRFYGLSDKQIQDMS